MTRKDYKTIAEVIRHSGLPYLERASLETDFARALHAENNKFDAEKFYKACEGGEPI